MSVSTRAPRRADRRHVVAHSHKARARGRDARPSAAARQLPVRRHVRHQLQRNYRPAGAAMCACASARAGVEARQYRQGSRGGAAPPATTLPKTTVRRTAMAEPLGVAAGEASAADPEAFGMAPAARRCCASFERPHGTASSAAGAAFACHSVAAHKAQRHG